jgi:acetolactate synthase-1/2/3 large subunit
MTATLRGADIVARSLERLGCRHVFTLSGNHIMSIFDAALETRLDLLHVRHEAAAVHMADAVGRLTGEPGIALVTGGPGHANAVGALFTAQGAESPMVLLSGHAATWELGRGGFQELRQAEMAAPVTKASWTATSAARLGGDIGEAMRIAASGRPGPVHVSLPSDLLEERVEIEAIAWPDEWRGTAGGPSLTQEDADAVLAAISAAARPIIIAGPQFANCGGRPLLGRLERAAKAPCTILESPRGMADATLGAFQELARRADLLVLLGKALDFTTGWASARAFDEGGRLIAIDPEAALIARAVKEKGERLLLGRVADARGAAEMLIARAASVGTRDGAWLAEARAALDGRPDSWASLAAPKGARLHPAEVFRALRPFVERNLDTGLICDGGEFAQWGQSLLPVRKRLINGVAGSIGCSLPFALSAKLLEPKAPVFAVLGDGTIGFHLAEFETAIRQNLPFVAVLGNDARWNAESQIQLREYGRDRMHGCELLPARYDQAIAALGGHGEFVDTAAALPGAIERSLASGKPSCINVMIESVAAPAIRRAV